MRICFVADNFDIRQRSAAPLAHLHAVAAMARAGHQVTLVLRRPDGLSKIATEQVLISALNEAQLPTTISNVSFCPPKLKKRGEIFYGLMAALWAKQRRYDLLWTRYLYAGDFATWLGTSTIVEHHLFLTQKARDVTAHMLNRPSLKAFVTISETHKKYLIESYNLNQEKLIAGHSAVSLERFQVTTPKIELRQQLKLPQTSIIMYCGSLYPGRGVEQLVEVGKKLPDATIVFVGGNENQVQYFQSLAVKEGLPNLLFCGQVHQSLVPSYLSAADILVLPHTADALAIDGTPLANVASPLKLFEYMAVGRPIVSSALEPIQEILTHEQSALLVSPGDVCTLINAISRLLKEPPLGARLGKAAKMVVKNYSWDARLERILRFAEYKAN